MDVITDHLATVRLNVCPFQASRTIRTEEAVLMSLARINPLLASNEEHAVDDPKAMPPTASPKVEFSDTSPSEESSDESEDE